MCLIPTGLHSVSNTLKCGAAATVHQLLLTQRYVPLAAPTSWIIGHQERYRLEMLVCVRTCVLSSQESPCAFFFLSKTRQLPASVLLSVSDLFELGPCARAELCVRSNVRVCLFMYTLERLCMSCVAFAFPPWLCFLRCPLRPHAAICFFSRLLIQRSLSQPITVSRVL